MTTPKPTPREALSHLCWALAHGENADEDVMVLSAALEQLSGNPGELDALRADAMRKVEGLLLNMRCEMTGGQTYARAHSPSCLKCAALAACREAMGETP